jgi:2-dehydro-3-deoxyphosphogluconate aldolase / (4S)-4-hydroxy-2-oxoglutarate aldolase
MDKQTNLKRLLDSGLVAVIRRPEAGKIMHIAEALVKGGTGALEITVDTPNVYQIIHDIKEKFSDRILVGAGTVLDAELAEKAIEAGADFIFSPNFDEETVQLTTQYEVISIPGCMTPSEIVKAYKAGADLIKIFPGSSLGMNYFKELQAPLGHIPMMPTGGVTPDNAGAYFKMGAAAVGVGGALLDSKAIAEEKYEVLTEKARLFNKVIQQAKKELVLK